MNRKKTKGLPVSKERLRSSRSRILLFLRRPIRLLLATGSRFLAAAVRGGTVFHLHIIKRRNRRSFSLRMVVLVVSPCRTRRLQFEWCGCRDWMSGHCRGGGYRRL